MTDSTENTTSTETNETLGEKLKEVLTLGIHDIADAISVIDHAAEQAAFRGWSVIEKVLGIRNKLAAFVSAAQAHVDAQAGADAAATTTETAPAATATTEAAPAAAPAAPVVPTTDGTATPSA